MRGASLEELYKEFGHPPWEFLAEGTIPAPKYSRFVPMWYDEEGREYTLYEDSDELMGCRLPIRKRRENPALTFPVLGESVELFGLKGRANFTITVRSVDLGENRKATAGLEVQKHF